MNVGQRKLNLDGIQLDSPALKVNGKGFIDFDQAINFDLSAHLLGGGTSTLSQVARRFRRRGGFQFPLLIPWSPRKSGPMSVRW
jgi:hypothetical protein